VSHCILIKSTVPYYYVVPEWFDSFESVDRSSSEGRLRRFALFSPMRSSLRKRKMSHVNAELNHHVGPPTESDHRNNATRSSNSKRPFQSIATIRISHPCTKVIINPQRTWQFWTLPQKSTAGRPEHKTASSSPDLSRRVKYGDNANATATATAIMRTYNATLSHRHLQFLCPTTAVSLAACCSSFSFILCLTYVSPSAFSSFSYTASCVSFVLAPSCSAGSTVLSLSRAISASSIAIASFGVGSPKQSYAESPQVTSQITPPPHKLRRTDALGGSQLHNFLSENQKFAPILGSPFFCS
jgi:hypothetical protein